MILSKTDYFEYLLADKIALGMANFKRPRLRIHVIWKFQILLRKCEYYQNCKNSFFSKLILKILKFRLLSKEQKLGFSIPLNVFGKGLSIAHIGSIVINSNCVIGAYCRIHEGVTIGVSGECYWKDQKGKAPKIGNHVFIGTGAKIIGNISISDDVAIGANSVVIDDIEESGTTWAGIPAKKISNNNSYYYINKL